MLQSFSEYLIIMSSEIVLLLLLWWGITNAQPSTWNLNSEYTSHKWRTRPHLHSKNILCFCWNGSMHCAATQVTFLHIKMGAIVWQNLCWVDLLPPLLLLATSTPLRDIMAGDSRGRLGFKVTVAVKVAAHALRSPMSLSSALSAIFNYVGEHTTDLDN